MSNYNDDATQVGWSLDGTEWNVMSTRIDSVISADGLINLGDDSANELTLASGEITITKSFHKIDTEGDAATDDLDTINGGSVGDIVILSTANQNRDITVKHETGNIRIGSDFTLARKADKVMLIMGPDSYWECLSKENND